MRTISFILFATSLLIASCSNKDNKPDAYGNFEAEEIFVSPQMSGILVQLDVEEGMRLQKGSSVGIQDTTQLSIKRTQLEENIKALYSKLQDPDPQIRLFQKQLEVLHKEELRFTALVENNAGSQKQLDDIQGKIAVLNQQILTTKDQSKVANKAVLSQLRPLQAQIDEVENLLAKCHIINPIDGVVLVKFAYAGEMASPQKPLYKIANTTSLNMRAFISGKQLSQIKVQDTVEVKIDSDEDGPIMGKVIWIADEAEFTPKTIQTKEERVNLVYAIKVQVDNTNGSMKIGMPGEVHFKRNDTSEKE